MKAIHIIGVLILAIIIIGGAAVLVNQPSVTGNATQETIKIGALFPLTGDVAQLGIPASQAVELAVEEANAAGGGNGREKKNGKKDGGGKSKKCPRATTKPLEK